MYDLDAGLDCVGGSFTNGARNYKFLSITSACVLSEFSLYFAVQEACI
jgi:hypothetical protein